MTLGEKIKADRKRSGLTQEQLADKICVSRQAIQKWESDNGIPSIENLKAIAQLFGVSIDSLVADEEDAYGEGQDCEKPATEEGSEEIHQETKDCPQCGTQNLESANFCKSCGYGFLSEHEALQDPQSGTAQTEAQSEEAVKPKPKMGAVLKKWFKANLKLVLPLAISLIVIIVLCSLIPTFISLSKGNSQSNNKESVSQPADPSEYTYYGYENGEYDTTKVISVKNGKWTLKDASETPELNIEGTYRKMNDKYVFYYAGVEMFRGTLKEDSIAIEISGETAVLCREGHTHSFGEWETLVVGDCGRDGFRQRACYCTFEESEVLPATGEHRLDTHVEAEEAKCTQNGNVEYYRCVICQNYFSDSAGTQKLLSVTIPAAHTEGEWKVIKEATCGAAGAKTLSCTVCETQLKSSVIDATGLHDWEKGVCNVCEAMQAKYTLSSDRQYYIVSGLSDAAKACKEIEILASYQGLPVKEIGGYSFDKCSELTGIILPEGIEVIRHFAFRGCKKLTGITLPESISEIEQYAFTDCQSLQSIVIPDGVQRISSSTFEGCSSLRSVTIPESVYAIDSEAFSDCRALQSIAIPKAVTQIGSKAFDYCVSLQSVVLPEGIEQIEFGTFEYCKSLKSIEIPDSVSRIGSWAFADCEALQSVVIPEGVWEIESGTFQWCYNLNSVTIPASVYQIGSNAFASCESLQSVVLPEGVGSIWEGAFAYCSKLKSISLPNSLHVIWPRIFYGCVALTDITYNGTKAEWNDDITKKSDWDIGSGNYTVHCTDGDIKKED